MIPEPPGPGDQSVYVKLGDIVVGHFEPRTWWVSQEVEGGVELQVWGVSILSGNTKMIKRYPPGEWSSIGRGD